MQEFFARRQKFLSGFPEARSVIVLGADYSNEPRSKTVQEKTPSGRIARYALSRDYHDLLRARLKKLQTAIQQLNPGKTLRFRSTVDTSAVQERALAEAAGLGFFGKNTCLIRPKGGSFFFLCTLITDLDLGIEASAPSPWNCGACTLCLDACPTGALAEPYRLDASLCISSLTIEHKGPVEPSLRPKMGDWIFWLRTFARRFALTTLTRPGREGLVRNAAIAAGNLADPSLIPALEECLLQDASALVRDHAAWALEQIRQT